MTETPAIAHDIRLINAHCFGGRSCHCLQVEEREGKVILVGPLDREGIGKTAFQRACYSMPWLFPTTPKERSRSSLQNAVGFMT